MLLFICMISRTIKKEGGGIVVSRGVAHDPASKVSPQKVFPGMFVLVARLIK